MLSGAGCSFKKVRLFADHKEDQSVLILFGNGNAELSRVLNTGILQNSLKFASILLNGSSQILLGNFHIQEQYVHRCDISAVLCSIKSRLRLSHRCIVSRLIVSN